MSNWHDFQDWLGIMLQAVKCRYQLLTALQCLFSDRINGMKTQIRWWILSGLLIATLITGFMLMRRDVIVIVDGRPSMIHTRALTVRQALQGMGISLSNQDKVTPAANTWLSNTQTITLDRSRTVAIWIDPSGTRVNLNTAAKTAREALGLVGITPAEDDLVRINGSPIKLDDAIPLGSGLLLQYTPAIPIQLTQGGKQSVIRSTAATLGQALWKNGVHMTGSDGLSASFIQPITNAFILTLTKAVPISISVDGKTIQTYSSAATVGAALVANGISLQNLDYSKPSEDSPLPQDGKIQVIRVTEKEEVEQTVTAFKTDYTTDNSLASGETKTIKAGQNGITATRVVIRYEDGKEVSRESGTKEVLQEAVNAQVAINAQTTTAATTVSTQTSTDGATGTVDTDYGSLSYYLSVSVHATSYSPCRSGGSGCSNSTASGKAVTKGVLGVTSAWYKIFKGYRIYIPGYGIGTVEDVGGGISGEYWIDLGYSDDDWVTWSKWVTVYFLTPAPSGFSGSLP